MEVAGSWCTSDDVGVAVDVAEGAEEACCDDDGIEDDEGVFARELEENGTEENEDDLGEAAAATFSTGVGTDACEEVVGVAEGTDEAGDETAGEGVTDPEVEELAFVADTDDWPGSSPV